MLKKSLTTGLLAAFMLTSAPPIARAGGTLRLDEVAVGELDPGKATDYADSILMFNVYDTLVLPKQGGPGQVPHLAESWEANEDATEFTFTLRDDVSFESDNALTAEDVVFSLDRMKALGAGFAHLFGNVQSVEALDAQTVKFTLAQPSAPFLASLVRLPIIDKALVMENLGDGDGEMGDWGQAFLSGNSAGTGAYTVEGHNPQSETLMAKNPDYFLDVAEAAPDSVRLRYGLEAATVRTLIAQGEHDIASQWLPPEVIRSLAENGAQLFTESGVGAFYVKMNTTKPPLDDVNCRQALAHAFDYETGLKMIAINEEISQGSASTGAIPVGMFGSNPPEQVLGRDMEAAKEYLAKCEHDPSEMKLELSWIASVPIEERFALLMQSNFAELGIDAEIRKVPWALYTELVSKPENTPHISHIFTNAVTGDPDTLLYNQYHSSVRGTWQSPEYLDDAKVDEYLDAGRNEITPEARGAAYSKLNDRLMELAPTIYGYDRQSVFAASNRVKAPALSNPDMAFGLDGMGFSFRLMEVEED